MSAAKAYTAKVIFTGDQWLHQHAAIVADGIITDVLPVTALHPLTEIIDFGDNILAPAFIDLQIYGAFEKLFAVYPDTNSLQLLNSYSNNGGAAFCMPTIATNHTRYTL